MTITKPKHNSFSNDAFFKQSMLKPQVAREFFESHLPPHILEKADLSTLRPEKDSFIDNALGAGMVDMLFSVQMDEEIGYLYVLTEQQSKVDYWMAFRLYKYMLRICDSHLQKHPQSKHLPLVYPLVFFTGSGNYNAPLDLWSLFKQPELARKYFVEPFQLVEVQKIPDEVLKEKVWGGIMKFIMKHVYARDIVPCLEAIDALLKEIALQDIDYIKAILWYTANKGESSNVEQVIEIFSKAVPEDRRTEIMTIAENLIEKGIQKGIEKGIEKGKAEGIVEIAKKMILKGKSLEEIIDLTGLSMLEVEKLRQEIMPVKH